MILKPVISDASIIVFREELKQLSREDLELYAIAAGLAAQSLNSHIQGHTSIGVNFLYPKGPFTREEVEKINQLSYTLSDNVNKRKKERHERN